MIFIQSNEKKTRPHHFDSACAQFGAIETEQDWKYVTMPNVMIGAFDLSIPRNLFVGSSEFMREVFKRVNITTAGVPRNANRKETYFTLAAARLYVKNLGKKIFIKPVENKLFTGFVLDEMENTSIASLPEETLVMAYEPFEHRILSEWRLYVRDNKIIHACNYAGDFSIHPNYHYALIVAKENEKDFPCAYTMDLAILDNIARETVVVEFNDMWAIGNYGLPNDDYLKMLRARYFEIVRGK